MLGQAAAFLDKDAQELIFIKDGKFEVPVKYTVDDLARATASDIQSLLDCIVDGVHAKECRAIMSTAVVEMTAYLPDDLRFAYLLTHLRQLKQKYDDGYQLYTSGFSYQKVRDEVEAARIEYAAKIHKIFSDIQNQLLGIPVATVIVATQMKDAKTFGYEFWVNCGVLVGCWIFAIIVVMLLRNQSHTLQVLKSEIKRQRLQIALNYATVAKSFEDTFNYLDKRMQAQRLALGVIYAIVGVGLALSHVVFFKLTPVAGSWLQDIFS
jgi:hypothetical protein